MAGAGDAVELDELLRDRGDGFLRARERRLRIVLPGERERGYADAREVGSHVDGPPLGGLPVDERREVPLRARETSAVRSYEMMCGTQRRT